MGKATTLDVQYGYRFYGDKDEAQYLHDHIGANVATEEIPSHVNVEYCPLCGVALDENGVCPKCGYIKK